MQYKRVLLKVSGESLMGEKQFGHSYDFIKQLACDVKEVLDLGCRVCIVVGGGNIYRGIDASGLHMDRVSGDYVGMVGTIINALVMRNIFESFDITTRIMSSIPIANICEPYERCKAKRHIEKGRVVIFAAGTGNPLCTTDSAAVLRALEMDCELLLKATKVDGVYDSDPVQNEFAKKYDNITYGDILRHSLNVMDMPAITTAKEHNLPIIVFSIKEKGNFAKILTGQGNYTKIEG